MRTHFATVTICCWVSGVMAAASVPRIEDPEDEVSQLVETLKTGTDGERREAVRRLAEKGTAAESALPELRRVLAKDPCKWTRASVPLALLRVSEASERKDVVSALVEALDDNEAIVRESAAWGLGELGSEASAATPKLTTTLQDEIKNIRLYAAAALMKIDSANKDAVPALATLLKDNDSQIRMLAATALSDLGPKAESAVPGLIETLQDKDRATRWSAASALRRIGPGAKEAVPALVKSLGDGDSAFRFVVACALARIDPQNEAPVQTLAAALNDRQLYERVETLVRLGKKIVPSLLQLRIDNEVKLNVSFHLELMDLQAAKQPLLPLQCCCGTGPNGKNRKCGRPRANGGCEGP
jgi:HEAT repeat protein